MQRQSTMPRSTFTLCSIISAVLCLVGCKARLEREEAERQLGAKFANERQYAYIQTGHNDAFGGPVGYVRVRSGAEDTDLRDAKKLADAGLLSLTKIATNVPMNSLFYSGTIDHVLISPTAKAKPLIGGVYPAGSSVCNDGCITFITASPRVTVTGVTEPAEGGGKIMSAVNYQLEWTNSEIGNMLQQHYASVMRTATFAKYDTGWRIEEDHTAQ